jgi:hypothetical protein
MIPGNAPAEVGDQREERESKVFCLLIRKHVVIKRLTNRGSADKPNWECELCPLP